MPVTTSVKGHVCVLSVNHNLIVCDNDDVTGGAKAHENGSASPLAVATMEVRGGSTTTATTTTPPPLVACDASSADCPKENSPTETLTSSSVVPLTGGDGHVLKVEMHLKA